MSSLAVSQFGRLRRGGINTSVPYRNNPPRQNQTATAGVVPPVQSQPAGGRRTTATRPVPPPVSSLSSDSSSFVSIREKTEETLPPAPQPPEKEQSSDINNSGMASPIASRFCRFNRGGTHISESYRMNQHHPNQAATAEALPAVQPQPQKQEPALIQLILHETPMDGDYDSDSDSCSRFDWVKNETKPLSSAANLCCQESINDIDNSEIDRTVASTFITYFLMGYMSEIPSEITLYHLNKLNLTKQEDEIVRKQIVRQEVARFQKKYKEMDEENSPNNANIVM